MEKLKRRKTINSRLIKAYDKMERLIFELEKKEIPQPIAESINEKIISINNFEGTEQQLIQIINKSFSGIIYLLRKELNIVSQNYYQNTYLAYGISLIGLPLGIIIYALTKNAAYIAIGLPIGISIGLIIGAEKDKAAEKEKRQINIELNS